VKVVNYRKQVWCIIKYIQNNFVAEHNTNIYNPGEEPPDNVGKLSLKEKLKYATPINITLGVLNTILGNNTLIGGDSGFAKTYFGHILAALLYQIPIELIEIDIGAPKKSREDILGAPEIGSLMQGKVNPRLPLKNMLPLVRRDELNRYTTLEQNIVRSAISDGIYEIAGKIVKIEGQVNIAAINPENYGGVSPLNENILDNFAIMISHFMPYSVHSDIVDHSETKAKELLGAKDLADRLRNEYNEHGTDLEYMLNKIEIMQKEMLKRLKENGVPTIYNGDFEKIRAEIDKIPFDPETSLLEAMLIDEMRYSVKYGENRSEDPVSDHSHDKKTLSTKLKRPLSGRWEKDCKMLAKAIAWLMGEDRVPIEAYRTAFIYTAAHRIDPVADEYQRILTERPKDGKPSGFHPLTAKHEYAKVLFEEVYERYLDLKQDSNTMYYLRNALKLLSEAETEDELIKIIPEAIEILKMCDHPTAKAISRGLKDVVINSEIDKWLKEGEEDKN